MNYYIQGDEKRAEEIKAAFEKLGYDTSRHLFNAKTVLYFTLDGEIRATTCKCTPAIIKTHPDYKELKLPIEPKFKVGDEIKTGNTIETIAEVDHATRSYCCESGRTIWFENQDLWKLDTKPHYNISNFHAGMSVLVRNGDCGEWRYVSFSHYRKVGTPFCTGGQFWFQCIPFKGNESLVGTTGMPDECYINW